MTDEQIHIPQFARCGLFVVLVFVILPPHDVCVLSLRSLFCFFFFFFFFFFSFFFFFFFFFFLSQGRSSSYDCGVSHVFCPRVSTGNSTRTADCTATSGPRACWPPRSVTSTS